MATAIGLPSCSGPERDRPDDLAERGRDVFAPTGQADGGVSADEAWTIVIAAYRGPQHQQRAAQDLASVQRQAGLPQAYVDDRGEATVIAYGRYDSPEDRRAIDDLKMVREIVVDGSRPFLGAMLSPPSGAELGSMPEYDLRNVQERLGKWVIYTLQVGAYGRLDSRPTAEELAEFRQAAEQAVVQLRREGEQAFYYHGSTMSLVLVGAWGERDFEASSSPLLPPRYEAPAIRAAKERFPHNLFNGQAIRERGPDGKPRLQPSRLVGVPDS